MVTEKDIDSLCDFMDEYFIAKNDQIQDVTDQMNRDVEAEIESIIGPYLKKMDIEYENNISATENEILPTPVSGVQVLTPLPKDEVASVSQNIPPAPPHTAMPVISPVSQTIPPPPPPGFHTQTPSTPLDVTEQSKPPATNPMSKNKTIPDAGPSSNRTASQSVNLAQLLKETIKKRGKSTQGSDNYEDNEIDNNFDE